MFKSAEYRRGYDAGYKQALLDALKQQQQPVINIDWSGLDWSGFPAKRPGALKL